MIEYTYKAAIYCRLSKEDSKIDSFKDSSNSIINQKRLLIEFAEKKNDIEIVREFFDDGYSGLNFQRPGFQELMSEVYNGNINCILVKDFSRLGRDYIETGRYIQKIFPSLGLRFISVNDNYDSCHDDYINNALLIPFKNIINDNYSRDISIKIRTNLKVKRMRGEFTGAFAPYGYLKCSNNRNELIIDEYAATVVKEIYNMKMQGYSNILIADRLNNMGIPSPYEYKKRCGLNYKSNFVKYANNVWTVSTIIKILSNRIYIGILEQGKVASPNYKIKEKTLRPKSEWIVVENNHEPIIEKTTFFLVQKLNELDCRKSPQNEKLYPLSGFIKCYKCGQNMHRRVEHHGEKVYVYYICSERKKDKNLCENKIHLREDKIYGCLIGFLNMYFSLILNKSIDYKNGSDNLKNMEKKILIEKTKTKLEGQIIKNEIKSRKLYDDYLEGILNKSEYLEFKKNYSDKIYQLKNNILELNNELINIIKFKNDDDIMLQIKSITREVILFFIDRIEINIDGSINIILNHKDVFQKSY